MENIYAHWLMAEQSWKSAIITVLTDAKRPLHYREITERILTRGLKTDGIAFHGSDFMAFRKPESSTKTKSLQHLPRSLQHWRQFLLRRSNLRRIGDVATTSWQSNTFKTLTPNWRSRKYSAPSEALKISCDNLHKGSSPKYWYNFIAPWRAKFNCLTALNNCDTNLILKCRERFANW